MLFGNGDYGFIALEEMPAGAYYEAGDPFAGVERTCTAAHSPIVHNYCGAVCITNLALYVAAAGGKLPQPEKRQQGSEFPGGASDH